MRITSILLALSMFATAKAQTARVLMGGGGAGSGSAAFRWETRLEPATPELSGKFGGGGVVVGKIRFHRYTTESDSRKYFGYDLLMEPLPEANTYRVTVRPLSIDATQLHLKDPAAWSELRLPGYPPPQILHDGDTIALDLFTNAETGQKIVDYIHIPEKKHKRLVYTASGRARDFTVEDAELNLKDPQISVNGRVLVAPTGDYTGGVTAAIVWFYLPERGRYFLSLVRHPPHRFQKAGEVRGSTLSFTISGEHIVVDCNGRIAPGYDAYNLYVLHQAGWRPKDGAAFESAGGDRLDLLAPELE
jgi:hypothetical protein